GGQTGDRGANARAPASGSAAWRLELEIDVVAVEVGHLGETLAERIEPDDVRVHRAQAHRHGVHPQLQLLPELADLALLLGQQAAEAQRVTEHPALGAATELQAEREGAAEDGEREAADQT